MFSSFRSRATSVVSISESVASLTSSKGKVVRSFLGWLSRRSLSAGTFALHQLSLFLQQGPDQEKMDDLLEQMLSLPSWSEIGGNSRAPWDFNSGCQANSVSADTGTGPSGHQKLFTMSLLPAGVSGSSSGIQAESHEMQGNVHRSRIDEDIPCPFEDQLMSTQPQEQQGHQVAVVDSAVSPTAVPSQIDIRIQTLPQVAQDAAQNMIQQITDGVTSTRPVALQQNPGNSMVLNTSTSQVLAAAASLPQGAPGLTSSPSVGSSGSEGSGSQPPQFDTPSPSLVTPSWCQPYMRSVLPLPVGVGQTNAESFLLLESMPDDVHLFGPACQQSHQQIQAGQGVCIPPYGSHTGLSQSQGAAAVSSGPTKPRVRARRGQATDPHSIAERLRRERIAERMKALQELVPNSNKTDKASMLDEIIEYVKFLQLQVKVLSMSRLGGAGAVAPLVAELPTEGHGKSSASSLGHNTGVSIPAQDGMAAAERQVARLMEEDMGSAMQYLQGKGLCLMPISLATVISSSSPRRRTNDQCGIQSLTAYEHSRLEASSCITVTSSSNNIASGVVASPVNTSGDVVCIDSVALGGNMIRNSKDSIQLAAVDKNLLSSTTNNGAKWNEEPTGQVQ